VRHGVIAAIFTAAALTLGVVAVLFHWPTAIAGAVALWMIQQASWHVDRAAEQ